MIFIDRIVNGFLIGIQSLLFGFRHFTIFWYLLLYSLVMVPVGILNLGMLTSMLNDSAGYVVYAIISYIIKLFSYVFIVAIMRQTIAVFTGKALGFWEGMRMNKKLWGALACFAIVTYAFESVSTLAHEGAQSTVMIMLLIGGIAAALWTIFTALYVPTVTIEELGFMAGVPRAARLFISIFVEWLCAGLTILCIGAGSLWLIAQIFGEHISALTQISSQSIAVLIMHPSMISEISPAALVTLLIGFLLLAGSEVMIAALYYSATHSRLNPFAKN